jgi:hypothetical protein
MSRKFRSLARKAEFVAGVIILGTYRRQAGKPDQLGRLSNLAA